MKPLDMDLDILRNELGEYLHYQMPEGWGFGLIVFPFNEDRTDLFFTTDANQEMITEALREFIQKQDYAGMEK